jgi:hypothetical protein
VDRGDDRWRGQESGDWGRAGELAPEQERDRRRGWVEPGPATGAARGGAELAATRGQARSGAGARPETQLGRDRAGNRSGVGRCQIKVYLYRFGTIEKRN